MTINSILQQWNVNIPDDIYLFDYLLDNKRSDCFFVDKLPLTVSKKNSSKFDQIDIFFQEVLEGNASRDDFLQIENKYRNFMTKLWLYNKLFVVLDMETVNERKIKDILEPQYQKYFTSISTNSETKMIEVLELSQLKFWVQMGIRDVAFPIFYFEDYKLLLTPSWSCYVAYLHEASKYQIVKDIATSEGLFLRQT